MSHWEPPEGFEDAKFIIDLGCNVGEVAHAYLERFPEAFVLGVELQDGLAAEAEERNPERFQVLRVPVGHPHRSAGIYGRLDELYLGEGNDVEVWTLDEILEQTGRSGDLIDLIKMDVEGEETRILAGGGEWVARTRAMIVEVHRDPVWATEQAAEALGFKVSKLLLDPLWNNHLWCVKRRQHEVF